MSPLETSASNSIEQPNESPLGAKKLGGKLGSRTPQSRRLDAIKRQSLNLSSHVEGENIVGDLTNIMGSAALGVLSPKTDTAPLDSLSAAQPAQKDADQTPLPLSSSRRSSQQPSPPDHMSGGNGGNGGNGGPKRPESGQLEAIVEPSRVLTAVVDELKARNMLLDAPHLIDATESIRISREHHFSPQEQQRMFDIINSDLMTPEVTKDGKSLYGFSALHGLYSGQRIPLENVGILAKTKVHRLNNGRRRGQAPSYFAEIDSLFSQFEKTESGLFEPMKDESGKLLPGTVLEIGPANGDFIIRARKWIEANKARGLRSVRQAMEESKSQIDKAAILPQAKALDNTEQFVTMLRSKRKVDAQTGDICADPAVLFEETNIEPASVDFFYGVLFLDRIEDMEQAVENIRYMARSNGSSRIVLGALLPFEAHSDVMTKNKNISRTQFWKPEGDIREQFMEDAPVIETFKNNDDLSEQESVRAQIIFNLVRRLNELGIVIETIGEGPYEVYSPHCILEQAGTIREKYTHLQDQDLGDETLNLMNKEVFEDKEKYPDDKVVGYPQRYDGDNKLLFLGGHVRPKNGRKFSKSEE